MPSLKILDAASVTTFVQTFQNAGGTTLMASVPINSSGTALLGSQTSANSLPIVFPSDAAATSFAVVSGSGAVAPVAVKAAAGTVFGINVYCTNSTNAVFLRLYNLGTASVNATSVPNLILGVPSGAPSNPPFPIAGVGFATAISYQITKLGVASDTTAVGASDLVGWITYV